MTTLPSGDELDRLLQAIQCMDQVATNTAPVTRRVVESIGDHMLVFEEDYTAPPDAPMRARTVYTRDGAFVGDEHMAQVLSLYGIAPVRRHDATASTEACVIGFSQERQSWWGWSHRALCGFSVGFVVTEGHVVTDVSEDDAGNDVPGFAVGFTAATLEDCKSLALKFASEVS